MKRSISRLGNSVKSMELADQHGRILASHLILGHLPKRLQDGHKALLAYLKPVHTVGTQALESEIAAKDFGDALRWQAGRGTPILVDQKFQLSLEDRDALSARVDVAVIPDLADAKEPLTTEGTRA